MQAAADLNGLHPVGYEASSSLLEEPKCAVIRQGTRSAPFGVRQSPRIG